MKAYLNAAALAELYGFSADTISKRWKAGVLLPPDVIVGRFCGWDRIRAVGFGQWLDVLDLEGKPVPLPDNQWQRRFPRNLPNPLPAQFLTATRHYLGVSAIAALLGVSTLEVLNIHKRGTLFDPEVMVGPLHPVSTDGCAFG